jgi:hypothetical protein
MNIQMSDLERIEGKFVGSLDDYETWLFNHAVADGMAERVYEGGAGFMGLAKVRLVRTVSIPKVDSR